MRKTIIGRAAVAGLSTLAIAGATLAVDTGTAAADIPWPGSLCQSIEPIQFYTDWINGAQSYSVGANEYIRVVSVLDAYWAYGHGTNHADRYFIYKHQNNAERLYGCH